MAMESMMTHQNQIKSKSNLLNNKGLKANDMLLKQLLK